jgi:hypothetical protein
VGSTYLGMTAGGPIRSDMELNPPCEIPMTKLSKEIDDINNIELGIYN